MSPFSQTGKSIIVSIQRILPIEKRSNFMNPSPISEENYSFFQQKKEA